MSFCLYTLSPNVCTLFMQYIQLFPLEIWNFFNELKKSGIRWSQPYRSSTLSTDTPCPEAERLFTTANVTLKQPIQILYYLAQLQMTSNSMYIVQIVVMLIFVIWLSLWFGQLCSRGHGTRCQGDQCNEEWTKIPMAIWQCDTPRVSR
jgi:hypothetical protein